MVSDSESGDHTEADQLEEFVELLGEMGPKGRASFARRLREAGELPPEPCQASQRDDPATKS